MLFSHRCQQYFGGTIWIKIFCKKADGGSINITPGIVFQENVMNSVYNKGETLQQKSKRLSIDLPHQNDVTKNPIYINKKNPASFNVSLQPEHSDSVKNFQILLHMWNILRCASSVKRE